MTWRCSRQPRPELCTTRGATHSSPVMRQTKSTASCAAADHRLRQMRSCFVRNADAEGTRGAEALHRCNQNGSAKAALTRWRGCVRQVSPCSGEGLLRCTWCLDQSWSSSRAFKQRPRSWPWQGRPNQSRARVVLGELEVEEEKEEQERGASTPPAAVVPLQATRHTVLRLAEHTPRNPRWTQMR